ncbi:hypothetical protein C6P40_001466 [Pichia californica]|uniref:ER membrane protein complex subunit 6 n=1 Tax=Pichia californica TaxID=460514 RepID=A0A9P6WJF4_9ASCO|nr:hypothetical protein C6P42_004200 [[Candida] californica]KAG0688047.1 hypothetical protein C6P40_001466 [[Candida] californica]
MDENKIHTNPKKNKTVLLGKEVENEEETRSIFIPAQVHNNNVLSYYKDLTCLILGSSCGILQLKAIEGLIFFIITSIISSSLYQISMINFGYINKGKKYTIKDFYEYPIRDIYLGDIGRNIATFTMMWCLLGALVTY